MKIVHGTIDNLNEKYDAIIHFQVLEHIKDDNSEILKNYLFSRKLWSFIDMCSFIYEFVLQI